LKKNHNDLEVLEENIDENLDTEGFRKPLSGRSSRTRITKAQFFN
jgi:hypothetical protein